MSRSRSPLYRGPLSPELASEVSAAALRNARRLIADAEVLVAANRLPTAVSLAVLAIEEATKAELVRLIVSASTSHLKEAWQQFRGHDAKQSLFIKSVLDFAENNPEVLKPELGPLEEMLSVFKELGLYVDLFPNGQGYDDPTTHFTDAQKVKRIVGIAAEHVRQSRSFSLRAMQLWRDCVGPKRPSDLRTEEQAIERWKSAMKAEGLES